jgi:hypothetical protein
MNYAELKNVIADTLNRQDISAVIPTFIKMAEAEIARKVRHWRQEKRVTLTLNEQFETLPGDWLETLKLYLDDGTNIIFSPVTEISKAKLSKATGKPTMYTINAGEIEFYPAPSQDYNLTMVYRARVPELANDTDTNWILNDYPDVYLYAALAHSAPYLQDDDRLPVWLSLKNDAITSINSDSQAGKYSGTPLKMRIK